MKIVDEISGVWKQIGVLGESLCNSRNAAEQKELKRDILSLRARLEKLQRDLEREIAADADPCQTPGCENEVDEHPTACTMCADREVKHDV